MKNMKTIFILSLIFCFISAGFMPSSIEKAGVIENAKADYVDANNNTSCIEPDLLVPGWSKDVRLTNATDVSNNPDIATNSSGNVYIVWEDARDDYRGIYYGKSSDGGKHWDEWKRINSESNSGRSPSIAIDSMDIIHVVWAGMTEEHPYSQIFYRRSLTGGDNWESPIRLTQTSNDAWSPKIAVSGSVCHVIWADERDGNKEIYYVRSLDQGENWEEELRLTNASDLSQCPSISIDSYGNPHIVWEDKRTGVFNIYYRKGLGQGGYWEKEKMLTNASEGVAAIFPNPKIAIDVYDNLHIIWRDTRSEYAVADILYIKSINMGKNWSDPVSLTKNSILTLHGNSGMPSILAISSTTCIVWTCTNYTIENGTWYPTSRDLYFTLSKDCGDWENVVRITHAEGGSRNCPKITLDNKGMLHVVWGDGRNNGTMQVYYKRTLNPVTEPPIIVTQSLNTSTCKPRDSITVSGNAVYNDSVVPNANVSIKILETGDEWNTTTDSNGDYSKTIIAPSTAGNYTIRVTIISDNHTGWKTMKLTVEQEATNGGTTNSDTTNGGQQPSGEENKYGINLNYVIGIIGVIAVCIILGVVLAKHRGKTTAKITEKKPEENIMNLRCPKCKKTFRIELKPKPFNVKCPYCGKEGEIK